MTPFDLLQVPLCGVRLIEAGAGTGKTYNIEGLYLRLILESGLRVDRIVVLTFTVAATEELRDRIRTRLVQLRTVLSGGQSGGTDPLIRELFAAAPDRRQALRAVESALLDFDRAAVHTIHGFCQRLLHENAVETGALFDATLVADPTEWIDAAASDFWRRRLHDAPPELVSFLLENRIDGPEAFAALYRRRQKPTDVRICGGVSDRPALPTLAPFRARINALRDQWGRERDQVRCALMDPALKGNLYGGVGESPPGSGVSPRRERVESLAASMDRLLAEDAVGFPLFDDFRRFTAQAVRTGTRKGMRPPLLPFFDACSGLAETAEDLGREMERYRRWLKTDFLATAPGRLQEQKRRKHLLFYDDLLLQVLEALRADPDLADVLGRRYEAALVDEFQDTDQIQYEICRRLFGGGRGPLFMIGDPKQAIYGFRGADIFSYLAAARSAARRYSLARNWRSAPALVQGVNELFSRVRLPFLLPEIPFEPAVPARSDAGADRAGLRLHLLRTRNGRPATKSDAVDRLADWVAERTVRLLDGGRRAEEIAVLVRTHRQARIVKAALARCRVPAVLYSTGSVFDTPEAEELQLLLLGVCRPLDARRVRAALSTRLMGTGGDRLITGESTPWWTQKVQGFVEAHRNWTAHGFMRMMRGLMDQEGVRRRLLNRPDGERMLTNVLHLVELCHRAEIERGLAPSALVRWLAERRAAPSGESDEEQLRLESDARAVQVVTVHRSKGLEFPVVFVPYGWATAGPGPAEEIFFHDPDDGYRPTLDLGGPDRKRNERLARTEKLAEDLRLLYVAVTRAVERCYLAWGRINQSERSSLAYLLYGEAVAAEDDPAAALVRHVKALSDEDFRAPLAALAAGSGGAVCLERIEEGMRPDPVRTPSRIPRLAARRFSGDIDRSWRVASFSHLASAGFGSDRQEAELPDRDRLASGAAPPPPGPPGQGRSDILGFPGGVRAGHFFHELLELAPFAPGKKLERKRLAAVKLRQYGFDEGWQQAVCEGIERVLAAPLAEDPPDLCLHQIPRNRRLHEMAFFFPLRRITPEALAALLPDAPAGRQQPPGGCRFFFSPVHGFLTGYIDLVFRCHGRYYLVDWKSNYLGPERHHYDPGALARVMKTARYDLQYMLYCLALDLFLRERDAAYRYETGFGGVYYLFLRGMDPGAKPPSGIYCDRPSAARMKRFRERLIQGRSIE